LRTYINIDVSTYLKARRIERCCAKQGIPFPIQLMELLHMNNLQVGTVNLATVIRNIDRGYVLDIDDQEVLLHLNDTKQDEEFTEEDEINVFLYNDKNEQIIATTLIPIITRDTFGWAEVINVIPKLGVFVEIGTIKEILVSVDDLPIYTEVWP